MCGNEVLRLIAATPREGHVNGINHEHIIVFRADAKAHAAHAPTHTHTHTHAHTHTHTHTHTLFRLTGTLGYVSLLRTIKHYL